MKLSQMALLLVTFSSYSFADITPISYDALSRLPIEAKGISKEIAKVDTTRGNPCEAVVMFEVSR